MNTIIFYHTRIQDFKVIFILSFFMGLNNL
jgi:hypothetical protein